MDESSLVITSRRLGLDVKSFLMKLGVSTIAGGTSTGKPFSFRGRIARSILAKPRPFPPTLLGSKPSSS